MITKCIVFKNESTYYLQTPKQIIQGFVFEDLGNDYAVPPLPTSHLQIYDADGNNENELFIGQGRVKIYPTADLLSEMSKTSGYEVSLSQLIITAKHYFGGAAQPTVMSYDHGGNSLDYDEGTKEEGKIEKMILMGPNISYIVIRGQEVAIDKICFYF